MAKIRDVIEDKMPDFVREAKDLFEEDYDDFINSYDKIYKRTIRLNTAKIDREFVAQSDLSLSPVPGVEDMFYVEDELLSKHPYHHMGLFYFQELSASMPVRFLDFAPDATVLDMCAAPGGKTLQLASKLSPEGELYSNDISVSRQRATVKNIERFAVENAVVLSEAPEKLLENFSEYFDVILVDAPCSGEGMFAKDSSVLKSWSLDNVKKFSSLQFEILSVAASLLKRGGRIMYSTCTFSSAENEAVTQRFLKENTDFSGVPINDLGFDNGLGRYSDEVISASNRVLPHRYQALGHYFILLEKKGSQEKENPRYENNSPPDYFVNFCDDLGYEYKDGYYFEISSKLYYTHHKIDRHKGLRVLRSGLLLGEFSKGRFVPSQAFAMTIKKDEISKAIHYQISDDNAFKYFRGETINDKRDKGYHLIFVDDYPCGFVVSDGNKLKNKYKRDWIQG